MINVAIIGPRGKMGKLITNYAHKNANINIVGAVAPKGRDYIGQDVGVVAAIGSMVNAPVVDDLEEIINICDIIIDYTEPEVSMNVFEIAKKNKKSVVCGTTGFSKEQFNKIKEYSMEIPVLFAANTSRLVNLMYKLLDVVTKSIGKEADIEIIEMHDKNKKDAPSGTSKEMGMRIAKLLDEELDDLAVYGRSGSGERIENSIGYHSIRSGDISSSHTVMFGLMGERLELTHHAYNWNCFAQGACKSAEYIYGKEPGFYGVEDIL